MCDCACGEKAGDSPEISELLFELTLDNKIEWVKVGSLAYRAIVSSDGVRVEITRFATDCFTIHFFDKEMNVIRYEFVESAPWCEGFSEVKQIWDLALNSCHKNDIVEKLKLLQETKQNI